MRHLITKGALIYALVLLGAYHIKYNHKTWEIKARWDFTNSRVAVYPGDPRYPAVNLKPEKWMHYDQGFSERNVLLSKEKQN